MIRTQVQIPDDLYGASKRMADRMEVSLTELVRRGLEYMVSVSPASCAPPAEWVLPPAHDLGAIDPFTAPDWREQLHTQRAKVAESGAAYGAEGAQP